MPKKTSKRSRKEDIVEESPSSTSQKHSKKKARKSISPSENLANNRLDTNSLADQAQATATQQNERFEDLDENMTREELQERYEQIRDLRVTGPEKLLKNAISAHKKESDSQQSLVENYKRRAAELQTQLDTLEQQKQHAIIPYVQRQYCKMYSYSEVEARVEEATEEVELRMNETINTMQSEFKKERATLIAAAQQSNSNERRFIFFNNNEQNDTVQLGYFKSVAKAYEDLTGVLVVMENWEEGAVGGLQCTAENKETKIKVQFGLELDNDVEEGEDLEWDYTPGANAEVLPKYLQEEISFPASAAPKFVTRLVDALYKNVRVPEKKTVPAKKIPYSKGMTVYYTKEGNTDTVQIIKVHLAINSLSVIITDSYEKKRIGLELDVNMLSGRISLNKTLNKKER